MADYYDRQGNPLDDLMEWARLFEDKTYQRVAATEIGNVHISTVWLGINHNWGAGPPLIFETMIFGGAHDEYQERYTTEAEALAGHERACDLVRSPSPEGPSQQGGET
jgi:hypothetical protein